MNFLPAKGPTRRACEMFSFNFYDDPIEKKNEDVEEDVSEIRSIPLENVLSQLPDTLAYSLLNGLPRRDLWHVKMQIMQQDQDTFLLGDSDVIKGSYEGGLKTWECSIDLAEYLSSQTYPHELSVLELGCGSAMPTAQLFQQALKERKPWKFVLQDYNDIFKFVTVPNLFLTWYTLEHENTDEMEVTEVLKQQFLKTLQENGIEIQLIVGAWSTQLSNYLSKYDLVLSSEGIYSPKSLPQFTSVLLNATGGHALVASKKIYFGVGGGVTEFLEELAKYNRTGQIIWEGGQVGRVIIQV